MGDLRLGKRALERAPELLEKLRYQAAGTIAAECRMGAKMRHPERYDERGRLKVAPTPDSTAVFPKHIGGPRWVLSDGSTVTGKRAVAEAAEQKLGKGH